jgi:hypothetical protein
MANLKVWYTREPIISRAFVAYLKFTQSESRSNSIDTSLRFLYAAHTVESDLFFFWGLLVQICECWKVAGISVTDRFKAI